MLQSNYYVRIFASRFINKHAVWVRTFQQKPVPALVIAMGRRESSAYSRELWIMPNPDEIL